MGLTARPGGWGQWALESAAKAASPSVDGMFAASLLPGQSGQPLWAGNKAGLVTRYTEYTFACVNLIADAAAQAPLRLYFMRDAGKARDREDVFRPRSVNARRSAYLRKQATLQKAISRGGEIVEVTQHPILDLLLDANPAMDGYFLSKITIVFLMLTGEAYTWMQMDKALNVPFALWPLPSQWVRQIPGGSGIDAYAYGRTRSDEIIYPAEQVIYHREVNPRNILTGYAKLAAVAAADQLHEEMNAYELFLFANRGEPGGVLQTAQKLTPGQRNELRTEWESLHRGIKRAGRAAVLDKGLEWKQTDVSPRDMAFLAGRTATVDELAAGFGVPVSMLRTENVNRANADAGERQFAKCTIRPLLTMLEQKWNQDLVPMYDERLFLAYDDPVPEDTEAVLAERRQNLETAVWSPDDIREQMGEERLGGAMEEYYLPGTLRSITAPVVEAPPPPAVPPPEPEDDDEDEAEPPDDEQRSAKALPQHIAQRDAGLTPVRRRFMATALRLWQQQARDVIKRIGQSFKAVDPSDVAEWLGERTEWAVRWEAETLGYIENATVVGAKTTLGTLPVAGLAFNIENPRIAEWLEREAFEFANETTGTTQKLLRKALQGGMDAGESQAKLVRRVNAIFGDRKRAELIVRTETKWAYEQGGLEAAIQSEVVVAKIWRTNPTACEYCAPYEGVTIELDSIFVQKGERSLPSANLTGADDHTPRQLNNTYRDIDIAQLHARCQCWTEWKLANEFNV